MLQLSSKELAELPEELSAATLSIRKKIGRRNVAYPMPVGAHSVTISKSFRPRTSDVVIITFHKTGTTLCQQMCHQLRTDGTSTDFKEITEVMPWIDFAWEIDQDLTTDQVASPRLFKSHARLSAIQEGCKYICTIRDPIKTLVSLFRFFTAKFPNPPFPASWLANVDNFAKCPLWAIDSIWGGNYWEYITEFWLCRDEPNLLLLSFEDLSSDMEKEIPKVAKFMGVEKAAENPDVVAKVLELSSRKYMSDHSDQFSEGWFYEEQLRLKRYDRPPLPPVAKVHASSLQLTPSEETIAWMQAKWDVKVTPKTGCKTYADMLSKLQGTTEE